MLSKTRKAAAVAIAAGLLMLTSGCGEDRSNLLPRDTAQEIDAKLDEVRALVRDGNCFEALAAAEEVRTEVEALGNGVDSTLQRTLVDGVTQLQVMVQEDCVEADTAPPVTTTPEPEPEPSEPVEPRNGGGATGQTGATGATGGENGGGGGGGQTDPEPEPEPEPTPPPDNGSGGVGPPTGGGQP